MKIAFEIYARAIVIYAAIIAPAALVIPFIYVIALIYVFIFGWFAWFVFTLIYAITDVFRLNHIIKFLVLSLTVIASVAVACNMMGIFDVLDIVSVQKDIWHSKLIIFPAIAVIAGWISLCISWRKIKSAARLRMAGTPGSKFYYYH